MLTNYELKKNLLRFIYPFDRLKSKYWSKFSRLIIKGEGSSWVLDELCNEFNNFFPSIDIPVINDRFIFNSRDQLLFLLSKYEALYNLNKFNHNIYFPYFHGNPEKDNQFKSLFKIIENSHKKISGIQVTNSVMENLILNTGIAKNKVFRIPISIDINKFSDIPSLDKNLLRKKIGIPESSFVIGSFQKDGSGWNEGFDPKMIKGPDIFINVLKKLKSNIKEIFVLLIGPSRGYIKKELDKINIPYKHYILDSYDEMYKFYKILDLYLITSREEGGPRALFESMICSIPCVTTNVGMAIDLVVHNKNGWKVEPEDIDGLIYWSIYVYQNLNSVQSVIREAKLTVLKNSYESQKKSWLEFFGFSKK
jgi:glycosyltransferase involved in cell wall biosynthesis